MLVQPPIFGVPFLGPKNGQIMVPPRLSPAVGAMLCMLLTSFTELLYNVDWASVGSDVLHAFWA